MYKPVTTVFMPIERKLKKIISILTFTRFSGEGRHSLQYSKIHYEKFQNANFLALININTIGIMKENGNAIIARKILPQKFCKQNYNNKIFKHK